MDSKRHIVTRALLLAVLAITPTGCARNDAPPAQGPGSEVAAQQETRDGLPPAALIAIGAAAMLLVVVLALENSGVGLVTPPPPGG